MAESDNLPQIAVHQAIRQASPALHLGLLSAEIRVEERPKELDKLINEQAALLRQGESVDSIKQWTAIAHTRECYRRLGKDPSRYRPSAEALLRRLLSGKELYRINNAVDALNLVSLQSGLSIGGYDAAMLRPPILLDRGKANEPYDGIGRGTLNIEGLPVLYDQLGPFGCPTSDSTRTAVSAQTRTFFWVIFDFGAPVRPGGAHIMHERPMEGPTDILKKALVSGMCLLEQFAHARKLRTQVF